VIVGASCRAAAASATAAGWAVHAADLFDDLDLAGAAVATRKAEHYPDGLVSAVAFFPPAPWCYTGALENHLHILDSIAARRPLAGNDAARVRHVRRPATLATILRDAGLRAPETVAAPDGVPIDGSFLRKPLASAGGRGIVIWTTLVPPAREPCIWQRRTAGEPLSAVLSLSADSGRVLGVTRQLVGAAWCRAPAFAFCGAILMPRATVPTKVHAQFHSLATTLAARCGLRGIVGVDSILESDGRLTVLEVNPRPTASAELIERAEGTSIMATHLAAFGHTSPRPSHAGCPGIWSKAILFAARPTPIDEPLVDRLIERAAPWTNADGRPALADIPRPGQVLRSGAPVLTVFARGDTEPESTAELDHRIAAVIDLTG
jgi:predicted ATP-grasp superfamily ATP-dependent carboligase